MVFVAALIIIAVFIVTVEMDRSPCSPGVGNHLHIVMLRAINTGNTKQPQLDDLVTCN